MATRASGSAVIQFGMVTIPTKLYLTASSERFSFNLISPEGNRCNLPTVDSVSRKEYPRSECKSGYKLEDDSYLIFSDEELDALDAQHSNTIEIAEFVENKALNPIGIEKSYYLSPDKGAEKPYRLLARALRDMNVVAVGKYFARGRDNLAIVSPRGDSDYLTLYQMYYANEVRSHEYSLSAGTEPEPKMLDMAKKLVKQMTSDTFEPTQYVDEYAERIRAAIETKRNGGEIAKPAMQAGGPAMDLAALLEASMSADAAPKVKTKAKELAAKPAEKAADKKPAADKKSKK